MRKILVLLTVLATALVFTTGAFADACYTCKCPLRNVPCPTGGQIAATCTEFDYDINAPAAAQASNVADGYCSTIVGAASSVNCRAILHVCDCLPDPTAFVPGVDIGIRMTILVNGVAGDKGAYWSNETGTAPLPIAIDTAATQSAACAIAFHGDLVTAATSHLLAPATYYTVYGGTVVAPASLPTTTSCTVAAASRSTCLESSNLGDFTIALADKEWWWIDIPAIRVDPSIIAAGSTVSVKVEVLNDAGGSICGGCTMCDCIIDVAKVCCSAAGATTTLTFPYFASNSTYWRGLAIINPGTTDGTATLTLHDVAGNTATATVTVPGGGLFVDSLDNITFTGTANVDGRSFVTATCNYGGAEGFAMMGDGSEAMGYIVD